MELIDIPSDDRRLMATWAIKTARTEEWTGQQVLRLLPSLFDAPEQKRQDVLLHARDEFRHAELYAKLADDLVANTGPQAPGEWVEGADLAWIRSYASDRVNFRDSGFTTIFRVMDSIPMCFRPGNLPRRGDNATPLIRFYTALFYLDLAGLMTVNVYDEAPFGQLQQIALEIREDESRHVHLGRDYLIVARGADLHEQVQAAALEMLPHIQKFFGGDDSPTQKALQKYGLRSTPNKVLFEKFKAKVRALLHVELP